MELKRGVSPAMLAALSEPSYPILFAHLDWPGDPVWAHTGVGTITWGGQAWNGVGTLGNIEIPEEAPGVAAVEAVLSLAGVPADLDGYADDPIRNRTVEIYIGTVAGRPGGHDGKQISGPGNTLIGTPVELFSGTMDGLLLNASDDGGEIVHDAQVMVATGVEARSMASIHHSDEDQRRSYPSDTAGRLVIMAFANAQRLTWPEN